MFAPLVKHCRRVALTAATLSFMCATLPASAAVLGLSFVQRTGNVDAASSIPVDLRLTNLDPSSSFIYDPALPNSGFDSSVIPSLGFGCGPSGCAVKPFVRIDQLLLENGFSCGGTFTAQCTSGPPYDLMLANSLPTSLTLAPGESFEYSFGTFVPRPGAPQPGQTYEFYSAALALVAIGVDDQGGTLVGASTITATCAQNNADACRDVMFMRTINPAVAAPAPRVDALLGLGLAAIWMLRRRQSRQRQSAW